MFYGWWVVAASLVTALYSGGVIFYGFTAVFEPIAEEMGWSYTHISLAASLRGLEMGLLAPVVGVFADRWGPRRIIFGGVVVTFVGMILLSRATSLGMFYVAFGVMALGTSAYSMTVLMTAVANWFHVRVGIASGIADSGFGFGGLLVPLMVKLIEMYDWRTTMVIMAVGMLVTLLPLIPVFRHKPEQYGYLPDGKVAASVVAGDGLDLPPAAEIDMGVRQVLKSKAFWTLTLAFSYHGTVVSAVVTHVMPYLSSVRIARSVSSLVATAIPLMSVGGRLGFGWLGDKLNRRLITAVSLAMIGLALLSFGNTSSASVWLLVPFILLFGIGFGGINALRPAMVREYFGRANFGTIFGLIIGINMVGGILGPTIAGWAYDNWGGYQDLWFILAGLVVAPLIFILITPPAGTAVQPVDKA